MTSTIGLTLRFLRRGGWLADVVERWIPHTTPPKRRDLFGVGDVLAARREEFLLVQATSLPNVGARVAKARRSARLAQWLAAGGQFEVWGWARRAGKWRRKAVSLSGAEMTPVVIEAPRRRLPNRHVQGLLFMD